MKEASTGSNKKKENERGAGILLHISSLPSPYGTGDLGIEARNFLKFLKTSGQKYWQILPLNPTGAGQGYSPYSAIAAMAGNPIFISPQMLQFDGLIEEWELNLFPKKINAETEFSYAEEVREKIFEIAFNRFNENRISIFQQQFREFCKEEDYWLHDYALYVYLKQKFSGKAWFQWPAVFKNRDQQTLHDVATAHQDELDKIKFLQFIFFKQWHELKFHANQEGVKIIGDMPIYVSYDSVDVWANPKVFRLDEVGNALGVAGVPPDAFSETGQLWGMPVFDWDFLKLTGYEWWKQRLKKNMVVYDLVRLDHFRAFSSYWEVPATEKTAINGEWKDGPGEDFFHEIKSAFGKLPFIAEDLGDIDDKVYSLRDAFQLSGMKVLQFAFGENLPATIHAPHNFNKNFIVYTGTHDNNTTLGWFRTEIDRKTKMRLSLYTGKRVSEKNVNEVMIREAYASVANICIIPMQDLLNLDEIARINKPASIEGNWRWRMNENYSRRVRYLRGLTKVFNRL